MMQSKRKRKIKIVLLLTLVLLVAILMILIVSKQVANPITKNANQRTQFFVDLGNLLPKKKDTIKNGTTEDTTNNTNASSTADTIIPTGGSLVPTKDTNKDGVVNNKDAVIDTNKDGVIDNKDTSAELLQEIVNSTPDNGPSAIPANNEEAWKEIIKRDTIATKDLVVTASTDMAKTRDQLIISWSSPTKMEFASCVGSYAGGVYQQKDLKSKGITLTAYVQKALYGWDGKQAVPTKPQTKKTQMPYGDKEIIYVLTCEKKPQAVISSTEKTETTSGGFGTTEGETEKMDTTPPKEYVKAQVALIIDDGTFNGGVSSIENCAMYPSNVSALIPVCNQNASSTTELVMVASPATVAPNEQSTLYWFSPAGTLFSSCEGVGSGTTSPADNASWIGSKSIPSSSTPIQEFDVFPKNKESRYAISCVTKSGKTLRANVSIQLHTVSSGKDFCAGLPVNLQKIYCPDIDIDIEEYDPGDTTGSVCSGGTAGQHTPLLLTSSEQEEYQKILRQFFRILPEIRTPESITATVYDMEELSNSKKYIQELTSICQEQTQDIANGDLVPDPTKSPKRRISPFYVDHSVIMNNDQATASGDTEDCRWDNHKPNQELILPWTFTSSKKSGNKVFINVPIYNKDGSVGYTAFVNPRAQAQSNVFELFSDEFKEDENSISFWNKLREGVQKTFRAYDWGGDGIGFNCVSDSSNWNNPGNDNLFWDTKNKCGFGGSFEKMLGIRQ